MFLLLLEASEGRQPVNQRRVRTRRGNLGRSGSLLILSVDDFNSIQYALVTCAESHVGLDSLHLEVLLLVTGQ